ncbi:uncharacterized protein E0L32_009352 [Thyridium curvatum]|uniref:DNA ligase n=1 Tax=Thyridium curvatum TaxID=1093900 RepID=A0A507ASG2_9PEZI|nr:uncharacterized protein E0L32_009352 [Thyridium curvatum]TPX09464.1 hypothetical protein E0L32_009352 [Thyridium curvatum]
MSRVKKSPSQEEAAREEDERQYGTGQSLEELDENYPNRPRNHAPTLLFSELFKNLFNPLNENKAQPGRGPSRAKTGPHGPSKLSPHEQRRLIIERFIAHWRAEVGDDFYPALRLILPDKDRDRGVYGLKENTIGKLLVKLMKIDRNSEDGYNLLHWKLPGQITASRMAGDFAGRCYEVLAKRQLRTTVGDMRIGEVNELLDQLAGASGESEQLPIFEIFYKRMNAEELMWLIRIILKQMKVGATERTFLNLWHPDGEALFSVSSSLRRVCWELSDPAVRLEQDDTGVTLMQCFQPQLAQFQMPSSFQKMVEKLRPEADDQEFWIEEKLDGERMQMHMIEDDDVAGGKRFCFWSRKAKDYTYLYGEGFEDDNSALTRHLKKAFADGVRNLILDGEMITWDPKLDKMVAFGTLKTAALAGQKNPHDETAPRPLFRVFDILYLNDQPLTRYTLRDRHKALERAVHDVHRRLEIHPHVATSSPDKIEPMLRQIVADSSEGLVLKNPRSMYRLNSRNDDWIKVKPEYMSEFGESLDCVVVGGYFGSGRRGGTISSFLCGLRAGENHVKAGASPEKCWSFFKVGGGFKAEDYAEIRHHTEGKWQDWNAASPPTEFVELGGGERLQYEKPDVWIRPRDSIVLSVKAASVGASDQFAMGVTLRFPRFRRLRLDRAWDSALDIDQFQELRRRVDEEEKEKKEMSIEDRRQRRSTKRVKRELVIAGQEGAPQAETPAELARRRAGTNDDGDTGQGGGGGAGGAGGSRDDKVFEGLEFCVLSEAVRPIKRSKAQLEALVKEHGGRISQRADPESGMILVADKKVVKVASLIKAAGGGGGGDDSVDIVKPKWLLDCLRPGSDGAAYLLPFETGHLFHATEAMRELARGNVDRFGDSYARDLDVAELREIMGAMPKKEGGGAGAAAGEEFAKAEFLEQLEGRGRDELASLKGMVFRRCRVHLAVGGAGGVPEVKLIKLRNYVRFGGGSIADGVEDETATHVVVVTGDSAAERELAAEVRSTISSRRTVPRVVTQQWVEDSWKESTLVDEEPYAPM